MRIPGAQGCVKQLTGDEPVPSAVVCTWSEAYEGGFATFSKGDLRRQIHQDYIMESFAVGYFVY